VIDDPRASEKIEVGLAFDVMRHFLHAFWERGEMPDALPWLLSAIQPSSDGSPMDQAQWHDFLVAVEKAKMSEATK